MNISSQTFETILDVGANRGHWFAESRAKWPAAEFALVEGNPECEAELAATGVPYSIAVVSDQERDATFYTRAGSPGCTGASLFRENSEFYAGDKAVPNTVRTTTLDALFPGRSFALIKFDLQGGELDAMRGAAGLLGRARAVLTEVAVSDYNDGAPRAEAVTKHLKSLGFGDPEIVDTIVHPVTREVIQLDYYFEREPITVVACCNAAPTIPYLREGFEAFLRTSRRYDLEPVLLGWHKPWGGLGSKPRLLKEAIETGQVSGKLLFCDAFDVAFLSDPRQIQVPRLTFNAERSCFPNGGLSEEHPESTSSFRFLNSGVAVGQADEFLKALVGLEADKIPDDHDEGGRRVEPNDQDHWMRYFLAHSHEISLDSQCQFLQTLHAVSDDEITFDGRIATNKETKSHPIVFHANGGKEGAVWGEVKSLSSTNA
jgi:FkbM family methyltransferase